MVVLLVAEVSFLRSCPTEEQWETRNRQAYEVGLNLSSYLVFTYDHAVQNQSQLSIALSQNLCAVSDTGHG